MFIVIEKATVSYKDSFHFCALFLLVAYFLVSSVSFFMLLNDSALQKLNPRGYNDVECHQVIVIPAPHHEVQYSEPHNEKPVSDYSLEIDGVKVEQQLACHITFLTHQNNEIKMEICAE